MSRIRPIEDADRPRLAKVLAKNWGSTQASTRGRLVDMSAVPGFIVQDDDEWLGYVGYEIDGPAMEVVSLQSLAPGMGVGGALLAACVAIAQAVELRRLWLITTNDNVDALRFYQRRGFIFVAVHRDAVTRARETLKPEIGLTGAHGIPLRDELELELPHAIWPDFVQRYSWPT